MKASLPKITPFFLKYQKFNILDVPKDVVVSSDKFQKWLLENFQGEAVEFWETYDIGKALFAFRVFCRFCPEVVFRTFQGQKVLVFSSMEEKVVRAPEVLIFKKDKILAKGNLAEKITLDLSVVWQKSKSLPFKERLEKSLLEISKLIKSAKNLYLVGTEPLVLFLFVYLIAGIFSRDG